MALDNSLFRGRLIKVSVFSFPDQTVSSDARVSRSRRSERMSPGSTGAAVAVATGVATGGVTVVEEGTNHIAPVEGTFLKRCLIQFVGLITHIAGAAAGDSRLRPIKVLPCARRNASPLSALLCIYATQCTHNRIRLYITERLIDLNKVSGVNRCPDLKTSQGLANEVATLLTTVFVSVAQHYVVQQRPPVGSYPSSLVGQTFLLMTSTVRDGNCEGRGY
jgi:hypothetical protein